MTDRPTYKINYILDAIDIGKLHKKDKVDIRVASLFKKEIEWI